MIQALDYGDRFPIFLLVAGAEIEDFLGIPRHFYLTRDTVRRLLVGLGQALKVASREILWPSWSLMMTVALAGRSVQTKV